MQQTVGVAARANARFYSLDARGLDKGRQPIGNYAPHDDTLGNLLGSFDIGADSINSLAVDTGGFVVKNTNIFDQVIAEIAAEAGTVLRARVSIRCAARRQVPQDRREGESARPQRSRAPRLRRDLAPAAHDHRGRSH